MKFRIEFTTLPPVEVEIDIDFVEAYAMHYCTERGLDPSTGKGPTPLSIQRIDTDDALEILKRRYPDAILHCPRCGNDELQVSHNTLSFYCPMCDEWFDEETDDDVS